MLMGKSYTLKTDDKNECELLEGILDEAMINRLRAKKEEAVSYHPDYPEMVELQSVTYSGYSGGLFRKRRNSASLEVRWNPPYYHALVILDIPRRNLEILKGRLIISGLWVRLEER